jgi:hypothetical protein
LQEARVSNSLSLDNVLAYKLTSSGFSEMLISVKELEQGSRWERVTSIALTLNPSFLGERLQSDSSSFCVREEVGGWGWIGKGDMPHLD